MEWSPLNIRILKKYPLINTSREQADISSLCEMQSSEGLFLKF